jgi:RNA polymerase sigma-70 factor (ECF subfamily)
MKQATLLSQPQTQPESATSDEMLMTRYASGELEAFEALYNKHKGPLYRYLLRQIKEERAAEDLFQEVWGKVVRSAARYEEKAKFTTWLYTIARNKVIDNVRHMKVVLKVEEVEDHQNAESEHDLFASPEQQDLSADTAQAPQKHYDQSSQAAALEDCIGKLPKHQLDCFLLKEEAGFTANAIAQITDASLEAIKSRLKTSYKNLRSCLQLRIGDQWREEVK